MYTPWPECSNGPASYSTPLDHGDSRVRFELCQHTRAPSARTAHAQVRPRKSRGDRSHREQGGEGRLRSRDHLLQVEASGQRSPACRRRCGRVAGSGRQPQLVFEGALRHLHASPIQEPLCLSGDVRKHLARQATKAPGRSTSSLASPGWRRGDGGPVERWLATLGRRRPLCSSSSRVSHDARAAWLARAVAVYRLTPAVRGFGLGIRQCCLRLHTRTTISLTRSSCP